MQSDTEAENTLVPAGDPAWRDYDLSPTATQKSGSEGFLVACGIQDTGNHCWWNLGGRRDVSPTARLTTIKATRIR